MTSDVAPRRVAFGLGSNVGDRLSYLQGAVEALVAERRVTGVAVSKVYETEPVGGPDQADYLNAVLVVDSTLEPPELLDVARHVEAAAQRERVVRWGPRTLDVDILAVAGVVMSEPNLTLPHARVRERAFVLRPWSDVDPEFIVEFDDAGRREEVSVNQLSEKAHDAGVRETSFTLRLRP